MTLAPLADLPLAVQLHLWPALGALLLGPVALLRRRRDRWHKVAGYGFVAAMAVVAAGSFLIEATVLPIALGLGPIHILAVVVLHGLWRAVRAARAGDIATHAGWMRGLYWQALILAGAFTLLPGRTLNTVFFPDRPLAGVVAIALVGAALLAGPLRPRRWRRARAG